MVKNRITIITGCPGTGKSTVSSIVAKISDMDKSVHMHTDDFYNYIKEGCIPPFLAESQQQNQVVIDAFLSSAKCFAENQYDVIVDGIIGPWFLEPWLNIVKLGYEVNYFILRANKEETMNRAMNREKLSSEQNVELVESMWNQFSDLGKFESYVIDTSNLNSIQTADLIKDKIIKKEFLL